MPLVTRFGILGEKNYVSQGEGEILVPMTPKGKPEIFFLGKDIFFLGEWAIVRRIQTEVPLSWIRFFTKREEAVEEFELIRVERPANEEIVFLDLRENSFEIEPELPIFENHLSLFPALGEWGKDKGIPQVWLGDSVGYFRRIGRGEVGTAYPISCAALLDLALKTILSFYVLAEDVQGPVWCKGKTSLRTDTA